MYSKNVIFLFSLTFLLKPQNLMTASEIQFTSRVEKRCSDVIKIEVEQYNTFKEFFSALHAGTENKRRKSDWLPGTDQIRQMDGFNWNSGSIHSRAFDAYRAVLSRVIAGINTIIDTSPRERLRRITKSFSHKRKRIDLR